MNFSKMDGGLCSALAEPEPSAGKTGGKGWSGASPEENRRFEVFVEFAADSEEAAALADRLRIAAPRPGQRIVTAALTADELNLASEHPTVRRLSLSRKLRPADG